MTFTRWANQIGPEILVTGDGDFEITDALSFDGVQSINPNTKEPTGLPLLVTCVSYDRATGVLYISPCFIESGQYRNCSAAPARDAKIHNQSMGDMGWVAQ